MYYLTAWLCWAQSEFLHLLFRAEENYCNNLFACYVWIYLCLYVHMSSPSEFWPCVLSFISVMGRYLGIQQVVFGGRRMGDWEEGMTSPEFGYKYFKMWDENYGAFI